MTYEICMTDERGSKNCVVSWSRMVNVRCIYWWCDIAGDDDDGDYEEEINVVLPFVDAESPSQQTSEKSERMCESGMTLNTWWRYQVENTHRVCDITVWAEKIKEILKWKRYIRRQPYHLPSGPVFGRNWIQGIRSHDLL